MLVFGVLRLRGFVVSEKKNSWKTIEKEERRRAVEVEAVHVIKLSLGTFVYYV